VTPGPLDGSVADLGLAYRSGATTPAAVVAESLARTAGVGADLGAVADMMSEAGAEADRLTDELAAGRDRGPLHGVPIVVKELIDVGGHPRRAGTHVEPEGWDRPVERDAPVVAALREAGAVVVARGRTHEFAWGITSRHPDGTGVVNPFDPALIAGGSSGGVAALVASRCAPVGVGTDTGGSIRIPAAFCGLIGWKPAFDRLSTEGVVPLAPSFDTVGLLTRTIADAVLADEVLGGGLSPGAGPAGRSGRVVVVDDPSLPEPASEITAAVGEALARAGLVDRWAPGDAGLPSSAEIVDAYGVIQRFEALAVHRDLVGTWPAAADAYGDDVAGRLRAAEQLDEQAVTAAQGLRARARAGYAGLAAVGVDALVLPTAACPPSPVADPDRADVDGRPMALRDAVMPFTVPANLLGWPAVALPVGPAPEGLRASVQVVAHPGAEPHLTELAARLAG
jgi:aspartyl-tRNA(Asn)/glutamyl-tRNA(Gln) amidotransferase subunit A